MGARARKSPPDRATLFGARWNLQLLLMLLATAALATLVGVALVQLAGGR